MSEKIKKLSEYQHSRLRTEMYLGSRSLHNQDVIIYDENFKPNLKNIEWVPALYTAFREILDNALDEVIGHKQGDRIDVNYDEKNLTFELADNGRGIPIELDKGLGMHMATLAMSHARAGRNFEERGEIAGTNGIGGSTVNFVSQWLHLDITRDGKRFLQEFQEGQSVDELVIKTPKISKSSGKTGTNIKFKLSSHVFPDKTLPEEFIRSRVVEVAIKNPGVKFFYNGERVKVKPKPEQNLFNEDFIPIEINEGKFRSKFYLVPNWQSDGEFIHTIVNNIPAFNGGSHIDAFRRNFYKNLLGALERESKRRKLTPNNSDIQSGLLVYNITRMEAPNFDSQSKTRLINEEPEKIIRKFLENEVVYKDIIRKNKAWIDSIYQRCADRTQKKDDSDLEKMGKKILRNKVPKLVDANGKDRTKCILLLTEGDSALAGATNVRDPAIHGGLPLRGKVLNVYDENPRKILENVALTDIMNSAGLCVGVKADRTKMRYGKIYLATDMDPDGANIAALLINFFYKFWPELFDPKQEPVIYVFQTPFLIGEKGKDRKYWYAHNAHEYDSVKDKEWKITRAKGLGTLTKEDWKHAITNPVVVPMLDDGNLKDSLELIFATDGADKRKEWIGM